MARPSSFSVRLQSLVLLVLIPGLLLSTAFFGWSIYRSVYGIIMTGFDQKLYAVSTVTGAFIRGEDHDVLSAPREVTALAAGADGRLLGLDRDGERLLHLDPETGGALEADSLPPRTRALAMQPEERVLWAATSDPAELHRVDLARGERSVVGPLAAVPAGLAFDPASGRLLAGGETLVSLDPGTARARPLAVEGLPSPVRAPAVDPESGTVFVLAGAGQELFAVDPGAGRARRVGGLHDPGAAEGRGAPAAPPVRALAFAAGELRGAADRLVRIDAATGAVDPAGSAPGFRSESHPHYARYAAPMRRIMERRGITYLYTEKVDLGGRLTYVIDATEGEDHSPIGTVERIADDEIPAMERAMVEGTVRLSDMEDWGEWGLLKTADAPIYREDGSVAALAAADVDISVILERTRTALVKVGLVAALTLALGAAVSLYTSRRLVAPLTEVKEGALQVAAGRYGHRIAEQPLVELRELSESFNSMSGALSATIGELTRANQELESVRRGRALESALADPAHQPEPELPFRVRRGSAGGAGSTSGFVHLAGAEGGRLLVWLAAPSEEAPLERLRLRREVMALARPLLARHPEEWEGVATYLSRLFPQLDAWILLDGASRTVRTRATREVRAAVVGPDGGLREVDLSRTPELAVGPREWVVVAEGDPRAAAAAMERDVPEARASTARLAVSLAGRARVPDAGARDLPLSAAGAE